MCLAAAAWARHPVAIRASRAAGRAPGGGRAPGTEQPQQPVGAAPQQYREGKEARELKDVRRSCVAQNFYRNFTHFKYGDLALLLAGTNFVVTDS